METFNVFNTLTSIQIFWKMQTLFKKLKHPFLFESTKIENGTFSYKTALSEAYAKTNRMGSTKWTYLKERSFASNYFILFYKKFCFSLRTSYKKLILCANYSNVHIHTFQKSWSFIWGCFFPIKHPQIKLHCWRKVWM